MTKILKLKIRTVTSLLFSGIGLAGSLSSPVMAQEPGTSNGVIELPEIVVSPTGTPTPANKTGSSVSTITREQIEAQQRRTVADALSAIPGLNVVQTGGPGGQTYVTIRGTGSAHVKVLIDGVDASDPSTNSSVYDFGTMLAGDVERIEVLRGPQSGLYGADAIGGVISITTKKGSGPPKLTAAVEGGSHSTFNQRAGLAGSSSVFNYSFNIDHFRSTDIATTPRELLRPGIRANPNETDNYTYSGRVGADVSDNLSLNIATRYTYARLLYTNDGGCFCGPDAERSSQSSRQFFTRAEAIWRSLDSRYITTLGVSYANQNTFNVSAPEDFVDPARTIGERLKFDLKQEVKLTETEKLTLGLSHERYSLDVTDLTESDTDKAAYVQLESSPFENFNVTTNVRYDNFDSFGGHATWRLAPVYTIAQTQTLLRASYGTGFKAPTLSQLHQDFPAFNFWANPDLRPEESKGFDIGFEQPFFDNRLRIGAAYYQNDLRNLITANTDYTTNINVGRAKTYGNESFVALNINEQLDFRADYTLTIAENEDDDQQLLRRPRHKASLQANWSPQDRLRLSATLLYVGSWIDGNRDFSIPRLKAPAYATVNLAANYDINQNAALFARVDNLFNRKYQNPVGYMQPGFGAFAGIRISAF